MYFLWEMQENLSDECGYDEQFKKKRKWDRVHSLYGMREKLPQKCFVNSDSPQKRLKYRKENGEQLNTGDRPVTSN